MVWRETVHFQGKALTLKEKRRGEWGDRKRGRCLEKNEIQKGETWFADGGGENPIRSLRYMGSREEKRPLLRKEIPGRQKKMMWKRDREIRTVDRKKEK